MIDDVFHYSYDPGCDQAGLDEKIINAFGDTMVTNYETVIKKGTQAFKKSIDEALTRADRNVTQVVPLSSGLDSRAILGGLLSHPSIDSSQVRTVSFGSPGTWDFEYGKRVAKAAGVSNTTIDLTGESFDWSIEALESYASERKRPGRILDGYINSRVRARSGDEAIIWSGFMGDPTAGGHQPTNPAEDWKSARAHFVEHNHYTNHLCPPNYDPYDVLPTEPYTTKEHLYFEEQLDFALRQQCMVRPIVVQSEQYRTPFTESPWLTYSLNLPKEYRANRRAFCGILQHQYPELSAVPTDAKMGLPLTASNFQLIFRKGRYLAKKRLASTFDFDYIDPATNYLDFENALRRDTELRETAQTLLSRFEDSDMGNWLDTSEIWSDHQDGMDRTSELRVICSLSLWILSQ